MEVPLSTWELVPGALLTLGLLAFTLFQWRHIGFRSRKNFADRDGHIWAACASTAGGRHCNLCSQHVYDLAEAVRRCQLCGAHAHDRCAGRRRLPCKGEASRGAPAPLVGPQHHWVKGNLPPLSACDVCNGLVNVLGLIVDTSSGQRCAWCEAVVHDGCRPALDEAECSLGRHGRLVLAPSHVRQEFSASTPEPELSAPRSSPSPGRRMRSRARRALSRAVSPVRRRAATSPVTRTLQPPAASTPLVVFVNGRSGGNQGRALLTAFRRRLNRLQVYDLQDAGPEEALRLFATVPRARVLVCGGDGTVGWILGVLDGLGLEQPPPVAVLPLGTGNDLARELGWGGGYTADQSVDALLCSVADAHAAPLDRWAVAGASKPVVMNNYFGIGVDAQVALEFHELRERNPGWFFSRTLNKVWYSRMGAKNFFERSNAAIAQRLLLWCDGEEIELPKGCEGIIVLNIGSYGGGARPWSPAEAASLDDGVLEVVAVFSSLHLGRIQVGLDDATPLCQCRELRIVTSAELPVQVDGEPWRQKPTTITIEHQGQAVMLRPTVGPAAEARAQAVDLLDWAQSTAVITKEQHATLMQELARRSTPRATLRRVSSSSLF